jgi:hypothetical protein
VVFHVAIELIAKYIWTYEISGSQNSSFFFTVWLMKKIVSRFKIVGRRQTIIIGLASLSYLSLPNMQSINQSLARVLVFLVSLLISFSLLAQSPDMLENLKNMMPPSPNSSAFARYGDWPVSLYTGVPNISIPITTLKGRTVTVPITLSYHGSGNRVGDVASWVGLGFSLNAGGVITRSMKGLNDEQGLFAYSSYYGIPDNLSSSVPDNIDQLRVVSAANNTTDSEPDIYYFNAMGRSYKLLILANGTVNTIPHSNIKFVSNPINGGTDWTVLLEDGTKLIFGANNYVETTNNPNFTSSDGRGIQFKSSWYLNSITSATGEVITFTYTNCNIEQDSYFSQSDFIKFLTDGTTSCNLVTNSIATKSTPSVQNVVSLNVSTIESDLEKVEFYSAPGRQDLYGGYTLTEIKVYSKVTSRYFESYVFNTGYTQAVNTPKYLGGTFNPSYFDKRLRLNSFEKKDPFDPLQPSQKWIFKYNSQNLPSRRSFAQDHWGFYNGANANSTLLPRVYFQLPNVLQFQQFLFTTGFMPNYHELGGNREGDGTMMQAEILNGIHYPTGGYSQFSYEPNSVPVTKETFTDSNLNIDFDVTSTPNTDNSETGTSTFRTASFTITTPSYVKISLSSQISPSILQDQPGAKVGAGIYDANSNLVVSTGIDGSYWFNLGTAGTYTFRVNVNTKASNLAPGDYVNAIATLFYPQSNGIQNFNQLTGGLRIASILDYDGSTLTNAKYYQYSNPLIINPVTLSSDYVTNQINSTYSSTANPLGGPTIDYCFFYSTIRNSSTKFALGSIQGGTTGYGQVKTLHGLNGSNGYTLSTFSSEPDEQTESNPLSFPYPPATSKDDRRGLLLIQKEYSAQNILLKQAENSYSFDSKRTFIGYKAGYSELLAPEHCQNQYRNCGITRAYYKIEAEQVKQLTTAQTIFDSNGQNPLTTTTTNYYDNPLNTRPVRAVTTNSEGQTLTTYSRTALEKSDINTAAPLSTAASTAIDKMLEMNMVNQVLQQRKEINAALENQATVNHKIWYAGGGGNPTIVAPENVLVQVGSNAPEMRIQFTNYDAKGNLLEQTKTNDARKSYIYNYNFSFPIAEATNADFASIAYTSFEADGLGNWAITGGKDPSMAFTGSSSGWLTGGNTVSKAGLDANKSYTVSFWIKNGTNPLVNGQSATVGKTSNGWTYYQRTLSGASTVTISGTGNIDEVRLFPQGALLTTYTYNAYGVSSSSTPSGLATFYEYDSFGRLAVVRDDENKIVKTFQYNYKIQP